MAKDFDQEKFSAVATVLAAAIAAQTKEMQALRLATDFQPFHVVVPTVGQGATTQAVNPNQMISPPDATVKLHGIMPLTQSVTTIVLQDGDDPGTQITLSIAAAQPGPVPLWGLPFLRGIRVISANFGAVLFGEIHR